jgi:integral membrane protein
MDVKNLRRFRQVAMLEGISYLFLLFIAMPVKYLGEMDALVKYGGWAHGILFVLYILLLLQVWVQYQLKFGKIVVLFIASLIPFAAFWADKKLKAEEQKLKAQIG